MNDRSTGHDTIDIAAPRRETTNGDTEAAKTSRDDLLISAWRHRQIPPRDYLQGEVFCTTSRWLIYGDTGVGKTLFTMDLTGSMASGNAFLGWEGKRKARVMYLDGEMPDETFKERMVLIGDLYGDDIALYGYNRDVLGPAEMPPLDTHEGALWLMREIKKVEPDVIVFDSIMSLLSGTMSEEESWAKVKLLVRKLSSMRIGQIWLHHTGHDTSHGFGTKTREWEMDTVASLTKAEDETRIIIEFKKARLRTPKNALQFRSRMIERSENGWVEVGGSVAVMAKSKGARSEVANLKFALVQAYDRLAGAVEPSSGLAGERVLKVSVDALREDLKSRGFLDTRVGGEGGLTSTSRGHFRRAKTDLLTGGQFFEKDTMIWRSTRREQ